MFVLILILKTFIMTNLKNHTKIVRKILKVFKELRNVKQNNSMSPLNKLYEEDRLLTKLFILIDEF